jgi:cytochrome c peroxidase
MAHAANAIAAYEAVTYQATNTPWDQYLRGDTSALGDAEKLGALLFYGAAGCDRCHSGPLLSDQEFHATGVPQLGPGRQPASPYDWGREHLTGNASDHFAFKTPPLRNVALTAPYMHSGTLLTLQEVVQHYAEPRTTAEEYDPSQLHPDLQSELHQDAAHVADLVASLSADLPTDDDGRLTVGLSNLRAFLEALTDPASANLGATRPNSVPSGLPVP